MGKKTLARLLGYALFLFGAKQRDAAGWVDMPLNTYLSFLTRMGKVGIEGLADRRRQSVTPDIAVTSGPTGPLHAEIYQKGGTTAVRLSPFEDEIVLDNTNVIQRKVVLLTLVSSGLLPANRVADVLGYTATHVREMVRKLKEGDAVALVDKRVGQRSDYRFTQEVRGQLIVQWAANALSGQSTSSPVLANDLQLRIGQNFAQRSIRYWLGKLGIVGRAGYLLELVAQKKRSRDKDG
jgi:hypothetical protein